MMDDDQQEGTTPRHQRFAVCPRCEGRRAHVNPSVDEGGLSAEDFAELGPEFEEDYFGGVYDVRCERCGGEGLVPRCTILDCFRPIEEGTWYGPDAEFERAEPYQHCWEHFSKDEQEAHEDHQSYLAEIAAERRMGA
jgi:hypothetical protein